MGYDNPLLSITLSVAVPLWQEKLRLLPWPEVQAKIDGTADVIASKGDLLLFRGEKRGESAEVFNRLAEGIAVMSFLPGGVTVFGQHWEAQHPGLSDPPKE